MTDPRQVTDRRELHFASMGDILDDVEYMAAGDPPPSTGNWTSAQIVLHVGRSIDYSIEGFPMPKAPLLLRIAVRLMRRRFLRDPWKPGVKLSPKYAPLLPEPRTTWDEAVDAFRAVMTKLDTKRMTARSPLFGKLSHEQWVQIHCRHAELHFSYVKPE